MKDLYDPIFDEVYGTCVTGGKYCDHICAKEIVSEFKQFLKDNKMRGNYISIIKSREKTIAQSIVEFVNENQGLYIDFVLVSPNSFI